jgi:hypothetical protein
MAELKPYEVVNPSEVYKGKSYSDWISDWFNWFFSEDPDNHNSGPVVFLRSFPNPSEAVMEQLAEIKTKSEYGMYKNDPNVMVGDDKLEMFSDQALLFPTMLSYWVATEPYMDDAKMRAYTRTENDSSDNPPDPNQVTITHVTNPENPINDSDIKSISIDSGKMKEYRVETQVFTLVLPDTEYGSSFKDLIQNPLPSGNFPAVVDGYFFLLTGLQKGHYYIHSLSRGKSDQRGDYYAEFLYHVLVHEANQRNISPISGIIPQRNRNIITKILDHKKEKKEIGKTQAENLFRIITKSRNDQARRINEIMGVYENNEKKKGK